MILKWKPDGCIEVMKRFRKQDHIRSRSFLLSVFVVFVRPLIPLLQPMQWKTLIMLKFLKEQNIYEFLSERWNEFIAIFSGSVLQDILLDMIPSGCGHGNIANPCFKFLKRYQEIEITMQCSVSVASAEISIMH